ncbi:MAG: restriction endonuclease subunit S [Bacteroidia bacterium]|nr:restriction endonuclease subunit S [Bacteroidia bacterium]
MEIKEVYESEVLLQKDLRLEADYWVQHEKVNYKTLKGGEIISFVQYGTSDELNEINEGYPILRLNEFDSFFIGIPSKFCNKLSKEEFELLKLLKDDVLICRTNGNPNLVGKSAIVPENTIFAYASYLFKIRPKKELISSQTLVSFLNSKYGRKEIDKYSMTSNQTNFSPAKFREIDIPLFGESFQNQVDSLIDNAYISLKKSKVLYSQAETLLLEAVGLQNFEPSKEKVNVKSFKDSFLNTGRLDAEYYQLKYEDYLKLIQGYKNGFEPLNTACILKDVNFNPDEITEYKYIELADIGKSGDINNCTYAIGNELPSRARRKVNTEDVIISSIEGSLESCAIVTTEYDGALCSTGFYVINSQKINSETLLILFKLELMQNILKQSCSGTILTAINKNEFLNIPIPLINTAVQQQISALVEESFRLKKESENLLELAKRAVEMAIEEGEERALIFINVKHRKFYD